MAVVFTTAGVGHFVKPEPFEQIIPDAMPAKREIVYGTGVIEVLGGLALLVNRASPLVGRLLALFLLLVFPANVNQALNDIQFEGVPTVPRWLLWARLPLQVVLVLLVLKATRHAGEPVGGGGRRIRTSEG